MKKIILVTLLTLVFSPTALADDNQQVNAAAPAKTAGDDGGGTAAASAGDDVAGGGGLTVGGDDSSGGGTVTKLAAIPTASVGDDGLPIPPPSPPGTVPPGSLTLVQQLTSYLAYNLYELSEYPPGTQNYNYFRAQRLTKQLAIAQAAAAAGTPLPPIFTENGQVAPLQLISLY